MASFPRVATDFDAIIQADRQRKKNAELAKEIFGRNKPKDNKKKDDKRPGRTPTPSLASRVGITKRSSSTSSNNPSPKLQPKPRNSFPAQAARANRIAGEINNEETANLVPSQPSTSSAQDVTIGLGISIKGASGPFVLHASNFAPGTTAADIESALHPDTLFNNGISSLVSCKLVSNKPGVVAELVFTDKVVAENIIVKYNGQKADGRILKVELVRSGVGSMSKAHSQPQQPQRQDRKDRQPKEQPPQQQVVNEPDIDIEPEIEMTEENVLLGDIEMDTDNFKDDREAADRDRRDRDLRRDRDEQYDSKRRGEDDRRRNDRDRDHERDRDHDRERDRDREYERREERPREERRGTMPSHYGNGVGGGAPPRGGFGSGYSGYRGGRYGDGYAGNRGGYRGNYRGYRP